MRWKFEVTENGQWVAGGECESRDRALSEASHYTMMYGQDGGDVKALVWTGRKPPLKLSPLRQSGELGK